MTDDYWGPMPDDSECPTPRERLDDGEADRLRALLRRWTSVECQGTPFWGVSCDAADADGSEVCRCYECSHEASEWDKIVHAPGCIVGDTIKELGE